MSTVIASVQRKGGSGKTTVAICVASGLSELGHRVALIDADSQRSAALWAEPKRLQFPVLELPLEPGEARTWVQRMRNVSFEFVIIDTAPNEYSVSTAVAVANIALIPCTPSGLDLDATEQALRIVNAVRARRPDPLQVLIVPNRVDTRKLEGRQLAEELNGFGEFVGPSLGDRRTFVRAFSVGESVGAFAPGSIADQEVKALSEAILLAARSSGRNSN